MIEKNVKEDIVEIGCEEDKCSETDEDLESDNCLENVIKVIVKSELLINSGNHGETEGMTGGQTGIIIL